MILGRILKFIDSINGYFKNFATGCIIVVSIMLFLESIIRLVWKTSIITVDEFGGLGMYMFIVLNLGPLYRYNEHLSTDVLVKKFSKKLQHILAIFLHLLTLLFGCLVTYLWWEFIFIQTFRSGRYLPMSRIIEWPFHLIGVVGWATFAITAAECLVMEASKNTHKINWGGENR